LEAPEFDQQTANSYHQYGHLNRRPELGKGAVCNKKPRVGLALLIRSIYKAINKTGSIIIERNVEMPVLGTQHSRVAVRELELGTERPRQLTSPDAFPAAAVGSSKTEESDLISRRSASEFKIQDSPPAGMRLVVSGFARR
jgi:hypothetical protein